MDTRLLTAASLLALTAASVVAAPTSAGAPDEARPAFVTGSSFALAAKQQATGIYVLGTTGIRNWTAVHYVLMRDGRALQIQSKAGGSWLPKVAGSGGGHLVGAERFDQLLALAGGPNRDAKQLPVVQRDRFLCVAGFGGCVGPGVPAAHSDPRGAHLMPGGPLAATLVASTLAPPITPAILLSSASSAAGRTTTGSAANAQAYFVSAAPGAEFRLEFDAATRRLWFDGWGIRAGWVVPPLDEL